MKRLLGAIAALCLLATAAQSFWQSRLQVSVGSTTNLSLDFVNNVYTRNGSSTSSFSTFLANSGSTFTRSTVGYDLAATVQFAINTARITTAGGLLYEATSTNLLSQSNFVSGWTIGGGTLTGNAVTGPDGTTTAATLLEDTSFGFHRKTFNIGKAATALPYAFSEYVKTGGTRRIDLDVSNTSFTAGVTVPYDLIGLQVGPTTTSGTGYAVNGTALTSAGNSFIRIQLQFGTDTGTGNALAYDNDIGLAATAVNNFFTGGGPTFGPSEWCAQLEQKSGPATSCIQTTSAGGITRGADAFTVSGPAGLSTLTITFIDNTTQVISGATGSYVLPTSINESSIKTMVWS